MVNKSKLINITLLILSFFALSLSYPTVVMGSGFDQISNRFFQTPNESVLSAILFVALYLYQKKCPENVFGKKYLIFNCLAFIASVTYVLTLSVSQNPHANISGKVNLLLTLIGIIGFTYAFTYLFVFLESLISKIRVKHLHLNYWYIVVTLLIIWILQIFPLFPGMVSWDGYRQFVEYFHTHINSLDFTYYPTNHHPWASTLIFGGLFSIGRAVGGPNMGLFTIVLVQLVVGALVYSKVIQFVAKKTGKISGIVTYIFYASPFVAFWLVTVEKTPLFLAFTTWFVLTYIRILLNDFESKHSLAIYVQLFIAGTAMSAFRNDGIFVVIFSLIILIVVKSKTAKAFSWNLLYCFIACLVVYLSWSKIALPAMNVVPGSTGESITLPMRQLSSVVIHNKESLSKKDLATINKITPIDDVAKYYNPDQADNLKSLFPVNSFLRGDAEIEQVQSGVIKKAANKQIKKETSNYLKLWVKEFFLHPGSYVFTFYQSNSQFLNPLVDGDPNSRGIMYGNGYMENNKFLQPSWYHDIHNWTSDKTRKYITWPNIIFKLPVIRTVLQPAFTFWIILFSIAYALFKKSYLVGALLPMFLLALVPLLSPVNGYERYMLPAMYVLPLLFVVTIYSNNKKQ